MSRGLILAILFAIITFLVGGGLGVLLQNQKILAPGNNMSDILNSPVISSISAYGQVQTINDKTVTLSAGGKTLDIIFPGDAQIYYYSAPADGQNMSSPQQVTFNAIKKDDTISANLKVSSDGKIQVVSAFILTGILSE